MYKIFADDTLIYDGTVEDYRIGKGQITLETNKSGSFVFSLYPEHFFYDRLVRLKTIITVYKSNKIVFRGRVLSDVTDYWNNKVITCEGELGFLQDSIIRPFTFSGTPAALFEKFVMEHNAQVEESKRFKVGVVTVDDSNNYIARKNSNYESTLSNMNSRLINDSLGGYFYITHGEDGTEAMPTLNYLADFSNIAAQRVEFGVNLKDYTKTVKADDIGTVIIPLGYEIDDGDSNTDNRRLTIYDINDDKDYVYDSEAVAMYGWITKVIIWDDVTEAITLKKKAEKYLKTLIEQIVSIELKVIDLHMIDPSIESFKICDYVRVTSVPHNFDSTLLCNKQTMDLLKPENDSLTLGYTYSTFTESSSKVSSSVSSIPKIQTTINSITNSMLKLNTVVTGAKEDADNALKSYGTVSDELGQVSGDLETIAGLVTENARNISTNASNIATNAENIAANAESIADIIKRLEKLEKTQEGTT